MQRFARLILAMVLLGAPAYGAAPEVPADARRAQVQAAETDAMESLRREVLAARINNDLMVADFLEKTGGTDAIGGVLRGATQIGGTRWIDDQTVIIRFELEGRRVADALVGIAKQNAKQSPVPAEALAPQLDVWNQKTFSATGTSTAAKYIVDVRPADANPAWRGVPEAQSRQALTDARGNAAQSLIDSLRVIPLADGKTVGDALEVPAVKQSLQDWLAQRPVVGLEFGDDLEVRMTIAAPTEELWSVFRTALIAQKDVPVPATDVEWERLHDEVLRRAARAVGRSYVPATHAAIPAHDARIALPHDAPAWVYDTLDADGTATGPQRSLKTARLAEDAAGLKLRTQIDALKLAPDVTIADAAKRDPRVGDAVSRSLLRARVYKVHWTDDGVTVNMTFNPRNLWDELRDAE